MSRGTLGRVRCDLEHAWPPLDVAEGRPCDGERSLIPETIEDPHRLVQLLPDRLAGLLVRIGKLSHRVTEDPGEPLEQDLPAGGRFLHRLYRESRRNGRVTTTQ